MTAETLPNPLVTTPHPHTENRKDLVRVYVWELPVRVTHWTIALSFAVLAVTGIYIGRPFISVTGEARNHFVMGWMRAVHFYAAIAFVLALLTRIVWMFRGNRYAHWNKFIPVSRRRFQGIFQTIRFYLSNLRKPPGFVGHNPLAGLDYTLIFLLELVMIASGFAMYSASANVGSPMRAFTFLIPLFGGLQTAHLIHHIVMWLIIGFAIHHVYSAILMSTVEANATIESIFSGYKFVPREDLTYSGYRFIDRTDE